MMLQLEGLSQPIDTAGKIWIPRADALRKLAQADSLKVYKVIAAQYRKDIDTLNKIISLKQIQIDTLKSLDNTNFKIILTYEKEIAVMKETRKLYETELASVNKELKRQRFKTKLTAFAGILTTGLALFLGTLLK